MGRAAASMELCPGLYQAKSRQRSISANASTTNENHWVADRRCRHPNLCKLEKIFANSPHPLMDLHLPESGKMKNPAKLLTKCIFRSVFNMIQLWNPCTNIQITRLWSGKATSFQDRMVKICRAFLKKKHLPLNFNMVPYLNIRMKNRLVRAMDSQRVWPMHHACQKTLKKSLWFAFKA